MDNSEHVNVCLKCGWKIPKGTELIDGKYCLSCAGWHRCDICNMWFRPDAPFYPVQGGMSYCWLCYQNYFGNCFNCGCEFHLVDMQKHEGKLYCPECYSKMLARAIRLVRDILSIQNSIPVMDCVAYTVSNICTENIRRFNKDRFLQACEVSSC